MKTIDTILFDLDGTLLGIDMNTFLPLYMNDVADYADHHKGKKAFIDAIWTSSMAMVKERDGGHTNEDVFFQTFCSLMGSTRDRWSSFFNTYYQNCFPRLKEHAWSNPDSPQIIEEAKNKGLKIVLATNPVFPLVAIEERIKWANLSSSDFSFITSLENMRSCKPHLHYYREILMHINKAPEKCLMVGNDVADDLPAGEIGIFTYLVEDMLIHQKGQKINCHHRGTLKDFLLFLQNKIPPGENKKC